MKKVHVSWKIAIICTLFVIGEAIYGASQPRNYQPAQQPSGREIRSKVSGYIRKAIPEPEATLGAGFLIGDKGDLPTELTNQLRILGLTHIIVASGYNLTILVRLARRLFSKISKYLAAAVSFGTIFGFIAITGVSPSMVRAGIVTGLSLLAWYYGRKIHPLVILPVAAAITVAIKPAYAWGDVGWQLSFAAFAGVMVFAPLIQDYFWGKQKPGTIRQVFIETLAAQLLTFPIIAYVFGQYSPLGLVSNMLVLPLIPLAMLLTFIAGVGGGVGVYPLGLPAYGVLKYVTVVTNYLANLPWAEGEIKLSGLGVTLIYAGLVLAALFVWRRTKHNFLEDNPVE